LKTLASSCEFGEQEESLIRDRVVLGIRDSGLQERLLRETELTLQKAAEFVRTTEISKKHLQSINGSSAIAVDVVRQGKTANMKDKNFRTVKKTNFKTEQYDCLKCGKKHRRAECPAYGKTCLLCKQKNHFAVGCKLKGHLHIKFCTCRCI
ncbi:unnamed protein product, partial [Larinioides sclopetarius]